MQQISARTSWTLTRLLVIHILAVSFSACSAFWLGWDTDKYQRLGWLKVEEGDANGPTGFNRLVSEMDVYPCLRQFVGIKGAPDFLQVNDRDGLDLAYLREGKIYQFEADHCAEVPHIFHYTQFDLPIQLRTAFDKMR